MGEAATNQRALKNGPDRSLVGSQRVRYHRPLGKRTRTQRYPRVAARRACERGLDQREVGILVLFTFWRANEKLALRLRTNYKETNHRIALY
jgi:hypothetical protein